MLFILLLALYTTGGTVWFPVLSLSSGSKYKANALFHRGFALAGMDDAQS